ncbi:DUF1810 domain-containing protein [Rhizobium sp. GN54]|uniref:DUF1810 domain-containing protein n=1 Tax=Rhizobium sp. GN54 TaxID=2898150 RepID=UPI001E2CD45E|nr:DUF1810 domain-containing protein [Rhizobium sp. GN54]MCD2183866.1 DUF1810 domain-containing protein [Rhizobium sp. GN54]
MGHPAKPAASHDLSRFHEAQEAVYPQALAELKRGRKETHWMWFVFPQVEGLGMSPMTQRYAIHSAGEARAYLADPVLGPRLTACVEALLSVPGRSAREIMGAPDDVKLRSSLTLFAAVADDPALFRKALARFYGGQEDSRTLEQLERW